MAKTSVARWVAQSLDDAAARWSVATRDRWVMEEGMLKLRGVRAREPREYLANKDDTVILTPQWRESCSREVLHREAVRTLVAPLCCGEFVLFPEGIDVMSMGEIVSVPGDEFFSPKDFVLSLGHGTVSCLLEKFSLPVRCIAPWTDGYLKRSGGWREVTVLGVSGLARD